MEDREDPRAKLFSDMLWNSNQPVAVGFPDGRIGQFNPAFCTLTGYSEKELLSMDWSGDLTPSEWRSVEAENLARLRESGEPVRYEKEYIHKDGHRIPIELLVHVSLDSSGESEYYYAFITDITKRKRAQKSLEESERRLSTLMGNLPGMAYRCENRSSWPMEFVSEGCRNLTGYTAEELTKPGGIGYGDLVLRKDRERVWENVQSAIENHHPFVFEYRIQDRMGREKWVWERGQKIGEGKNGAAILEGFITDISELKQAEAEKERSLRDMKERTKELSCLFQVSESIRQFDDPPRLFQEVAELIPEGWQFPAITRSRILIEGDEYLSLPFEKSEWKQTAAVLSGGRQCGGVEVYYIEKCPESDEGPFLKEERDLINGIARMLSEALELNKVDKERVRLVHAIEQAAETIIITDMEARIQYVNPAFEEATGYSSKEALGANPRILKSGEHDKAFYEKMWDTLTGGETWRGRLINKTKGGAFYTEEAVISPVIDETGRIVNYVGVKRNITNELALENQLRQSQKMEAVGRLAGGVAHDFNNMLEVILGHSELILEQLHPDQPYYTGLNEIRQAANRSANLTRQLLAFARRQIVSPEKIDLNKTVWGMTKMLKRLIGENIELIWQPGEDLWSVNIDPSQIDQILANLCVNSRDAINDFGEIIIKTGNTTIDEAFCTENEGVAPGEYILLSVADNGEGIQSETMDNIFEPFFTTKELGRGTGLGLAMVYGIVKQNEGFIKITSEIEQGTTVEIYLPRQELTKEQIVPEGTKEHSRNGNETVLLVEDESAILNITKLMLENIGYRVIAAASPEEAINKAKEYRGNIDLLISDVVMPEINGRELSVILKNLFPDLKCMFMSGYTADIIAKHGILNDGVDFIQKPFSKGELASKIREVLEEV